MATPFLPGILVLPARDDGGAAKRARDEDLQALREESDARGWSSSVLERSLALRRRRCPASASGSPTQDYCSCVTAASKAGEFGCSCEGAATPDAVDAGTTAAEETTEVIDLSCVSYFCGLDLLAAFVPPSVETPLVPPSAFVTDLDGGIIILDAKNDDRVADDTADEHGCRLVLDEAAATDAVGSGPAAAEEEAAVVDPYLSYFCVTL